MNELLNLHSFFQCQGIFTKNKTPRVKKKYEPKHKPLTKAQRKLIGRLLVEILEGAITDETRKDVCALNVKPIPMPFSHLVGAVQGSSVNDENTTIEVAKDVGYFAKERYMKRRNHDPI